MTSESSPSVLLQAAEMVLVPREPTEAMLDKGQHVNSEWLNDNAPINEHQFREPVRAVWAAMLAASPQATVLPQEQPKPNTEAAHQVAPVGTTLPPALAKSAGMNIAFTRDQLDGMTHADMVGVLRLRGDLLSLEVANALVYFMAQDGLLEKAERQAERLGAELAETKRPLDAQMGRLNERVTALNQENFELKRRIEADALLVPALKRLSFAAQITGGIAGPDAELMAAIEQAGTALAAQGKPEPKNGEDGYVCPAGKAQAAAAQPKDAA